MHSRAVALTIICAIVGVASLAGFLPRFRHKTDLEQWTVGGRAFGLVLVWVLMAGEIFTAFTFLGASGWAYSRGAPVLWVLGQVPLSGLVAFFILPVVWEAAQKHRLQTQADFFHLRYGSSNLAAFVALVGVVSLVPYLQVQLAGLGYIVEVASYGVIHRTTAVIVAFTLVTAFVFVSGVRGVAWASAIKDVLMLFAVVFVGFAVPYIYFGGIGPMFAALVHAQPGHLVMPGATKNLGHRWYTSTVILAGIALYMWPHLFASSFTARSASVLRRNAVVMPLYAIMLPLMIFAGLAAVLVLPGLENGDQVMLTIVQKTFPAWFMGTIGGAGALAAMIPAAIQLLSGATLYAKNLFRPLFAPGMSDARVAQLARAMVLVLAFGALYLAIYSSISLVSLLLLGYAGVAQFFPGVALGLFSKRVTTSGVFAGLAAGISIAAFLMLSGRDPYKGFNAGFVALCFNFLVTGVVSLLTRARVAGFDTIFPQPVASPRAVIPE